MMRALSVVNICCFSCLIVAYSVDCCAIILQIGTFMGHWTDHAARTGKCGMPVGSVCGPSSTNSRSGWSCVLGPGAANSLLRQSYADGRELGC
jgi:hypothetical protein